MSSEKVVRDLRSRQLNPCDKLYWLSRGYPDRPDNWKDLVYETETESDSYYENEEEYEESDSYDEEDCDSDESYTDEEDEYSQSDDDQYDPEFAQYCNERNPNNEEFWKAKGWTGRPHDWKERIESGRF